MISSRGRFILIPSKFKRKVEQILWIMKFIQNIKIQLFLGAEIFL